MAVASSTSGKYGRLPKRRGDGLLGLPKLVGRLNLCLRNG